MQLAGVADDAVVEHELGATAGVPRRLVAAAHGQLGSGGPGQDAGGLDRVGPVGQASAPPPARAIARSGQHDGGVPRLIRQGRFERRQLGIGRPVGDARARHGWSVRAREEYQSDLEQGEVTIAAAEVARSVASSPGSSEVRSSGSASDSGLATTIARRRGSSAAKPNWSCTDGATNG